MRNVLKVLRAILLVILLVVLVGGAGGYWWLRSSLPQLTGQLRVTGLAGSIEILRDEAAIPHIRASNPQDAFFGLGYVHAQDRLWQMEFQRRIGMSRLSEVLGPASLDVDRFLRTLGPDRAARSAWQQINPATQAIVTAYVAGINQFIATHHGRALPIEFTILGFEPQPWQPEDVLVWAKMMAWNLGGNWEDELLRAEIEAKLGRERTDQLFPAYTADGPIIASDGVPSGTRSSTPSPAVSLPSPTLAQLQRVNRTIQDLVGLNGVEVGSNNWVISGARTTTGRPMMANDPHLGSQAPSIWYLAHVTGGELDAIGATLPGVPGVVIGHNRSIAWAVTNTGPDVQDLFRERINSRNEAEYQGKLEPVQVLSETIKVKGQADVVLPIQITRHGPIITNVTEGVTESLAFRWTALDPTDPTIEAFIGINLAQNWTEFTNNLRSYHTPMQNFVYADTEGNIGYYAPGALPTRRSGDGKLPVPGWTGEYDWTGYVPFEELPHTFNPPDGFIASANNKAVPDDYPHFVSSNWAAPYRAARIVELIKSKPQLSLDDMALIQRDVRSIQARQLLPVLLSATIDPADTRSQTALNLVRDWDGSMQADSAAPAVYEAWYHEIAHNIFSDELGSESWANYRGASTYIAMALVPVLLGEQTTWCDDITTTATESCPDMAGRALKAGLDEMTAEQGTSNLDQWQWGKVHQAIFPHNPLDNVALLRPFFSREIRNSGDGATVNVAPVRRSEGYDQYFVASYRGIMDVGAWDNSRFIHTLGQSGHPLSPHYSDFLERWQRVNYLPMRFDPATVDSTTTHRLTLTE